MRAGGLAAMNSNGPQMMFIDLKHRPDNMEPWDRASVEELAAKWKQVNRAVLNDNVAKTVGEG